MDPLGPPQSPPEHQRMRNPAADPASPVRRRQNAMQGDAVEQGQHNPHPNIRRALERQFVHEHVERREDPLPIDDAPQAAAVLPSLVTPEQLPPKRRASTPT